MNIVGNRIRQKELPNHSTNLKNEHLEFIDKWVGFRQFANYKEKYKNNTDDVIRYKLVA